jgi:hypothetical protein
MVDDRKISTWLSYGTSKICLVLLEDRREICEGITARYLLLPESRIEIMRGKERGRAWKRDPITTNDFKL